MVKSKGLAVPGPGVGRSMGGFRKLGTSPQEKRMREHSEASGIRTSSPVITRWRRGWGSSGGQGSLAKALSWADPITFGGGGGEVLSGIKGSNLRAGRVAEGWGGGVRIVRLDKSPTYSPVCYAVSPNLSLFDPA